VVPAEVIKVVGSNLKVRVKVKVRRFREKIPPRSTKNGVRSEVPSSYINTRSCRIWSSNAARRVMNVHAANHEASGDESICGRTLPCEL
jgi:hypothetical protein